MSDLQVQARALGNPTRHRIFRYLADADGPVGVAELTEHFALNHNAIRQHLAKLVAADLLEESTAPRRGRGRPRLIYEIAPEAESRWGVTGPYERLSHLLAEVIRTGDPPVVVGRRAADRHDLPPAEGSAAVDQLAAAMAREGFEPEIRERHGRVEMVLRNCPFETAAAVDPETVCALHRGLAEGFALATGAVVIDDLVANEPARANCRLCVHVLPAS